MNLWTLYYSCTFSRKTVLMTFLIYVICVFSGPFGTYENCTLAGRAAYWAPIVGLALCVSGASCLAAMLLFPRCLGLKHALIAAGFFMVLYSPLLFVLTSTGIFGHLPVTVPMSHLFATVVAMACVLGIWGLVFGPQTIPTQVIAGLRPRLYARLSDVGDRMITRITVQDHYVDIHLSDGSSHRLLMRFSDAVSEMDDADGFCTHRSHWVARNVVRSAIKDGPKEFAILGTGERIPVSKTYRENLVLAGFL